jgi:hypothetical protein
MAALNRFISRLGEKGIPFFKLLKKADDFQWTDEADAAFKHLKKYLRSPPVVTVPTEKETLLLYIGATTHIVSIVIIVEREEEGKVFKVQRPIYYISEVLSESKVRYLPQATTLLRDAHHQGGHQVPHWRHPTQLDAMGRISKWAVELGAYNINVAPQTAIKSQALVDFNAEWTEVQVSRGIERPEHWTMYFDSSLKLEGVGAVVLLISPKGEHLKYVLQILWKVMRTSLLCIQCKVQLQEREHDN